MDKITFERSAGYVAAPGLSVKGTLHLKPDDTAEVFLEAQSIYCIVPPHILRHIARSGSESQRNTALDALAVDGTLRTTRLTYHMTVRAAAIRLSGSHAGTCTDAEENL